MKTLVFTLLVLNYSFGYSKQDTITKRTKENTSFLKRHDIHLILKTDILFPILETIEQRNAYSLTAEIGMDKRISCLSTGLFSNSRFTTPGKAESSSQIIGEGRYFLSNKRNYTGLYTGFYFKGIDHLFTEEIYNDQLYTYLQYKQSSVGGGLTFGYQNYFKKIVLDFTSGIGAKQVTNTKIIKAVNIEPSVNNKPVFDFRIGINLGCRF
jgi:hypothetical protein